MSGKALSTSRHIATSSKIQVSRFSHGRPVDEFGVYGNNVAVAQLDLSLRLTDNLTAQDWRGIQEADAVLKHNVGPAPGCSENQDCSNFTMGELAGNEGGGIDGQGRCNPDFPRTSPTVAHSSRTR